MTQEEKDAIAEQIAQLGAIETHIREELNDKATLEAQVKAVRDTLMRLVSTETE